MPILKSLVWLDPEKIPAQAGFKPGIFRSQGGCLTTRPTRRYGPRGRIPEIQWQVAWTLSNRWSLVKIVLQQSEQPVHRLHSLLAVSPRLPAERCTCWSGWHRLFPSSEDRLWTSFLFHTLVGPVVRRLPQEWLTCVQPLLSLWDFSQVDSYLWLTNWFFSGYPARCYRVSARSGWPGVNVLWLSDIASLLYNLYPTPFSTRVPPPPFQQYQPLPLPPSPATVTTPSTIYPPSPTLPTPSPIPPPLPQTLPSPSPPLASTCITVVFQ